MKLFTFSAFYLLTFLVTGSLDLKASPVDLKASLTLQLHQLLTTDQSEEENITKGKSFLPLHVPTYNDFETNPYITAEEKELIRPFLLPIDHPMRPNMDAIFLPARAVVDKNAFLNAGFDILFLQPRSFIAVGRHPLLPDYLIKANFDTTLELKDDVPAWQWFVQRCVGVGQVEKIIQKYKIKHCVTPKKYIYPLPPEPSPPDSVNYSRKTIVLLVDDMHLVDEETNLRYWKTIITESHLNELYMIMSRANGRSYRADNIPFNKDKKIAFIDTEYPTAQPNYKQIRRYLSKTMRHYWDELVAAGGPKELKRLRQLENNP